MGKSDDVDGEHGNSARADGRGSDQSARARQEQQPSDGERRLRESEARLRFALEVGGLGMWEWDREFDTWVWNERWAAMRGYGHDEIQPRYDDWHPDDEARLLPIRDEFMDGRRDGYEVEYRVRHRDGSWRWINSRTRALRRAPDGRPLSMVGVQADIHERREGEQAAHANQRWFELAIGATGLGLWDWDAVRDRITWSPRCAEILGYDHADMPVTAATWHEYVHPDDQDQAYAAINGHLRGAGGAVRIEFRARARDGHWVWLQSNGRVVARDARGRALRCVGTWQDLRQIKQAELALRESEARLRTVVDNSPIGIFLADAAGEIVYFSPVILALVARRERRGADVDWTGFVHPDDQPRVVAAWRDFIAAPGGVYDQVWRAVPRPGTELHLRVRAAPIRERNRVLGFAGTMEDISEQLAAERRERALQAQLRHAQKIEAIGTLTGGIAHDFNNSLATILGFATLARSRDGLDAKLAYYLDSIVQAAEHSRDLVRKLLDFSRSEPVADVAPLDAARAVDEAVRMLEAVIPATIRIVTVAPRSGVSVLLDATGFQQVLLNLVLNARDAISGHGQISIALTGARDVRGHCAACQRDVDGEYVELAVSDDGAGIPTADMPRIFDPFYSTKEVGQGTGMGLAVLHGIVHRADGHVLVESTPGQGTRMRVLLRVGTQPADAAAAAGARDGSGAAGPRLRALVVDDEPAIVRFLDEWLDCEGHGATTFTDPLAARRWAAREDAHFDVLVTDQTMPGMTGLELARALRARRPALPVIVCTGLADRVDAARDLGEEHVQVLLKPVPLDELRAALARVATHSKE